MFARSGGEEGDVTSVRDDYGELGARGCGRATHKPIPEGLGPATAATHPRESGEPSLPFSRDFQLPLPRKTLELVRGLAGALTGPALGRAHLEQTRPCTSQG